MLAINYIDKRTALIIDGQIKAELDVIVKKQICKNGWYKANRFIQHRGDDIFYVDDKNKMATLKWSDIEAGKYKAIHVVDNNVKDFSMSKYGVGVLQIDGKVKMMSQLEFDLKAVDDKAMWTNLDRVAKHWIVTGSQDDTAILASVGHCGLFRSSLEIQMTSNYFDPTDPPEMYSLRTAFVQSGKAFILAIERDGFCHLILMN